MTRPLIWGDGFVRDMRKLVKRKPKLAKTVNSVLELLEINPFHPQLKTHKLKGELQAKWSCSAGYDLRIVFELVQQQGAEAILLHTVGSHDEVY